MNDILKNRYETIKKEFLAIPEVESVTASSTLPTDINWWISINWEGQQDEIPLALAYAMVDYDYFKTLNIEIMDGRSFTEEIAYDDSISYMISELALKRMGIDNPVGKRITMNHNEFPERFRQGRIIGVFKDIHFSSLHNPVSPLLLRMYKPWLFNILIKYNPHSEKTIMSKISDVLKNVTPGLENEIYFLDSEFDRQYKQEIVMGKLFESFAIITTSIFVLGLLGLIGFITENKTKEIGIRKVNGAKIVEILVLLNRTFIIWVVIAFVIATPIAWYVMHKWLENFAYKTDLSWWIFASAGLLALVIALLTVSWQSWRAATRNPLEALRYE
jgi:putative ABC transport system permease protein